MCPLCRLALDWSFLGQLVVDVLNMFFRVTGDGEARIYLFPLLELISGQGLGFKGWLSVYFICFEFGP